VSRERYYRVRTAAGGRWARQEEGTLRLLDGPPWAEPGAGSETLPLEGAPLLAPVGATKIVAVGRNYRAHAAERGKAVPTEPLLFYKPLSAVIGPGEAIRHPGWVGRVDHEAELAVVIGKTASRLPGPEGAEAHVFGATAVNDVTARELQDKDVQFTRAKGFDTFCPMGPCLATGLDLGRTRVVGRVNGEVRQDATTEDLVFSVAHLVWYVSRVMTLFPGDMISTGTPSGVGPLRPGDETEVEVEGVGTLANPVVEGPRSVTRA
jgi:2-keto-4-pentenoate hydratase/2-oxohepta-3-ene-1,7-dioic acid hydratase in catechol pathway